MFFLCFILAIMMLKITSCYVWRVQVEGNSSISAEEIILFLENQKCAYGTRIAEIDVEALESEVREHFADIIWTSIDITGTCITVNIKENLILDNTKNKEYFKEDLGYDLVAEADGVIYSIVTRAGVPLVASGDKVKRGEVLVRGQISIEDDSETIVQYLPCIADADVILQQEERYSKEFPLQQKTKKYKEDFRSFYYLETRNSSQSLLYSLIQKQKNTDCFLNKKQLCLWNNYYLPVYWCQLQQKQYTIEKQEYTKKEAREKGKQLFEQYLREIQQKGVQIVAKNVMISFEEDECMIQGNIVTHKRMESYEETSIPKIDTDEGQNEHESQ